jgi:hypothetical protein
VDKREIIEYEGICDMFYKEHISEKIMVRNPTDACAYDNKEE